MVGTPTSEQMVYLLIGKWSHVTWRKPVVPVGQSGQQAPPANMDLMDMNMDLPGENVAIEKKAFLDFQLGDEEDQDETQIINEKKQIIDAIGGKKVGDGKIVNFLAPIRMARLLF